MTPKLYFAPGSCAFAALAALEEAGADYEAIPLILANDEQRTAAYLAINPRGTVPSLVVDGHVIAENIAVLTYIAHAYEPSTLLPVHDPIELGRAYQLMSWFASSLHIAIAQIWRTARYTRDTSVFGVLQQDARENLAQGYLELDRAMNGPWILGEAYSMVDPYAYVFWRWGERLGFEMSQYRRWAAQTEKLLSRPAVQRAIARESGAHVSQAAL